MILGLDIGGTKIRAGLVDPSGRIASLARHGDSMAMKIFDEFASSLAFALAGTVCPGS